METFELIWDFNFLNVFLKLFVFETTRSLRQGVAVLWRQASGEAQDARLQVHAGAGVQRDVHLQRAVGEDPRVLARRPRHGL
jgi:hypothetical protein